MNQETKVLKAFGKFKYKGEHVLSSGNSELFTRDVLGLDPESPIELHPIVEEILERGAEIPVLAANVQ